MDIERQEKLKTLMESSWFTGIGLVIAILLLAVGIHLLRSWFRDRDDPADSSDELLNQMEELHLEGDLSEEEFRSIKSRLRGQQEA